ncbi:hypothetical protein [Corynebacterium glutamicum]|uniref:hypothetical protein n=1 Tax=Corynebacterium glutamicum TaxID=1718 RepID=UPI000744B0FF|nr:hypothetical protein [Corynebacterium glutamicum]ALZ98873.1 hypothetical protein APT58_00705 [Corynebacterium glutamicum]SJM66044.1 hypothetical protein FM102_11130 [Corynebacterium glutamicum]
MAAKEKAQLESVIRELEQKKRQVTAESQGRGFFSKWMKKGEDECRLSELNSALVSVCAELDKLMPIYRKAEAAVSDLGERIKGLNVKERQAHDQAQFHQG